MKKRPSKIAFNNTSMLDVIFIILIFFISVSRLQEGWINIKLPEARASEERSSAPAMALTVSIDAENRIMADRREVAGETELAAVARKFAGDAGPEAPVVMIADRSSKSGTLVGALKAVRDAGLTNISFSYEPRKERR